MQKCPWPKAVTMLAPGQKNVPMSARNKWLTSEGHDGRLYCQFAVMVKTVFENALGCNIIDQVGVVP